MKSESGFHLPQLLRKFIEENPIAEKCLNDTTVAEDKYLDVERALFRFLHANDFDPKMMLCVGFKEPVVGGSRRVQAYATGSMGAKAIQHVVVCVNELVLDFGFRRLGEAFATAYNYPLVELKKKFEQIKVSNNLANSKGNMLSMSAEAVSYVYTAERGTRLTNSKKTVTLRKGDKFDLVARSVLFNGDKFVLTAENRQRLIDKSKLGRKKPQAAAPAVKTQPKPAADIKAPAAEFDKFDSKNYVWYRFGGTRKLSIKNRTGAVAVSIAPGTLFGLGQNKGKLYLLLADDARQARVILQDIADKLIAKSKITRAKITLINPGKPKVSAPPPVVPKPAAPIIVPQKIQPARPTMVIDLRDDEEDDILPSRLSDVPELEVDDASDLIDDFKNYGSYSCATSTRVKP